MVQDSNQYTNTYLTPIYIAHIRISKGATVTNQCQLGDHTQEDNQQHFGINSCN
jgi:hypothetical protein